MDDRSVARSQSEELPATTGTNVKETIESILVAFILAFVFRAFVVEAFVIPTGSMGTTLLGAHLRFACRDCGYSFPVNYSAPQRGDEVIVPSYPAYPPTYRPPIHCPNCGFRMAWDSAEGPEPHVARTRVDYGDRILVLKYLYLFQEPQRWDVVVFKSPSDPSYQMNFIKRLVGKPGESLMVLDGDVYVRPVSSNREPLQAFKVQTKPCWVQNAMWRVVYDNDYQSLGVSKAGQRQPWVQEDGGSGWRDESEQRQFVFDNAAGAATLRYVPEAKYPADNARTRAFKSQDFTDWLAYDSELIFRNVKFHTVSDLKVSLFYERKPESGSGPLRVQLGKLGESFVAEIQPDRVRLMRGEQMVGEAELGAKAGRAMHVEFQNVDYQVTLRIDGTDVIRYTYEPNIPMLENAYRNDRRGTNLPAPTVWISAAQQACTISHLSLWRDVYYTNIDDNSIQPLVHAKPDRPITLGPDEYFVMGDNSLMSSDARYWDKPIRLPNEELDVEAGRVPGRFLLGKAFFVYWPAGYRPFTPDTFGIVPDFGDLRFIH